MAELCSPEALLRAFPPHAGAMLQSLRGRTLAAADALQAFKHVEALPWDGAPRAAARRALSLALDVSSEPSPKRRRCLVEPCEGVSVGCNQNKQPVEEDAGLDRAVIFAWLPAALGAALPLLAGALPKDTQGLCVIPHPHPLVSKRAVRARRYFTVGGRLAYDTNRACDNCDRPIKSKFWFACSAGCEVDFCTQCHRQLQEAFAGRDIAHASWAAEFVTAAAALALKDTSCEERRALMREMAFEWPTALFEQLVRAVADVANAKAVHLEDARESKEVAEDVEFWHVVGFLQLLHAANELPARELRFGELTTRGPRVPSDRFVLGAMDKCDATSEWQRWRRRHDGSRSLRPIEEVVIDAETFEVSQDFAFFLAHRNLVPIVFCLRCLCEDVCSSSQSDGELRLKVLREPQAILAAVVATFGDEEVDSRGSLSVKFMNEAGEGPGVVREFLVLAWKGLLADEACWEYDPQLRTSWFREATDAPRGRFRAVGALMAHAVLTGTHLPASLPSILYRLLLRHLGSPLAAGPLGLSDLATASPMLARGLKHLLDYEGADLAEMFPLDWPRGSELTAGNRVEHVQDYVQWFFEERFGAQCRSLCEGFEAVIGCSEFLKCLVDAGQLEQIVCGSGAPFDVAAVRLNAEMMGWSTGDKEYLEAFWRTLESLDDAGRRRFVVFVSACEKMPPAGWREFGLTVRRHGDGDDRLPSAYTCFNLLLLPRYSSAEMLSSRLNAAISETEGFGLN